MAQKEKTMEPVVPRKMDVSSEFMSLLSRNFGSDVSRFDISPPQDFRTMIEDPWLRNQNPEGYKFKFYAVSTEDLPKLLSAVKDALNKMYWDKKSASSWFFVQFQSMNYAADGTLELNIGVGSASQKPK